MKIVDARSIKEKILAECKHESEIMKESVSKIPKLCIVQVEGDKASDLYVNNKIRTGSLIGIEIEHIKLPSNISEIDLKSEIIKLNNDNNVDGIIVQLPLPEHINEDVILEHIHYSKDVDGLGAIQQGLLSSKRNEEILFKPCTAQGVLEILKSVHDSLSGKKVTIINRSHLIGKPLIQLLLNENCTVTVCHSKTSNDDLLNYIASSDIVITGIGQPHYFDYSVFKNGQTIIDCSMNMLNGKLVGDVNIESMIDKESCKDIIISSGKGQTGPLTVACLMRNTIKAAKNNILYDFKN